MRLFAIFRGVLRDALDADGKKIVNLGMPTQDGDAANKAYVDSATGAVLDDTVTQSSSNGVKSSGIWSFVKSLLPSWLTSNREEPPTREEVDAKRGKYDLGVYKWVFTCEHPTIKFFSLTLGGAGWSLRGGETADSMRLLAMLGGDESSTRLEGSFVDDDDIDWDIACYRSGATDELATKTEVAAKLDADDPVLTPTAPSVDADETALAGAKATGDALAAIDNTLGEAYNMASGASNWVATVGQYRVAHLDDSGLADDDFAADFLSKPVAKEAIRSNSAQLALDDDGEIIVTMNTED